MWLSQLWILYLLLGLLQRGEKMILLPSSFLSKVRAWQGRGELCPPLSPMVSSKEPANSHPVNQVTWWQRATISHHFPVLPNSIFQPHQTPSSSHGKNSSSVTTLPTPNNSFKMCTDRSGLGGGRAKEEGDHWSPALTIYQHMRTYKTRHNGELCTSNKEKAMALI